MRRPTTTWTLLLLALAAAYVGWLGWRPETDYSTGQVVGFLLTVEALLLVAYRAGLPPRRTANAVFWVLLAVNFFDLCLMRTEGGNFWLASAVLFGPCVWALLWWPASRLEPPAPVPVPVVPTTLDTDAQVEAWRRYRDRMTGGADPAVRPRRPDGSTYSGAAARTGHGSRRNPS